MSDVKGGDVAREPGRSDETGAAVAPRAETNATEQPGRFGRFGGR